MITPEWGDSDIGDDSMDISQGSMRMKEKRGDDLAGARSKKIRGSGGTGEGNKVSEQAGRFQNHIEIYG